MTTETTMTLNDGRTMTYQGWMAIVDKLIEHATGLSSDDLPDVCYADWFERGVILMTDTEALATIRANLAGIRWLDNVEAALHKIARHYVFAGACRSANEIGEAWHEILRLYTERRRGEWI